MWQRRGELARSTVPPQRGAAAKHMSRPEDWSRNSLVAKARHGGAWGHRWARLRRQRLAEEREPWNPGISGSSGKDRSDSPREASIGNNAEAFEEEAPIGECPGEDEARGASMPGQDFDRRSTVGDPF
mmetsp:Transcript_111497/g.249190  ORF Transcript_111497/g.249190 Transcript_111497/m.249190 type:complete len:128 (-) Transcript_111497:1792-2175(-)